MLKVFRSRNDNVYILGTVLGNVLKFDYAYISTIRDKEKISDGVHNYIIDIPEKAKSETYIVAINSELSYEISE